MDSYTAGVFCKIKAFGTLIGLVMILHFTAPVARACPIDLPIATIYIEGNPLTVELATTPTTRGCGLSHRDALPENRGMLFIFSDLRPRNFWMKDTAIPLSIAYLDKSGQIFSIQDMAPLQTDTQYPSLRPAAYALEVNQGWFGAHGIEVGAVVDIKLPMTLNIR
jgi:uncharacterized membrane protein (UPF0127 family)